MLVCASVVNEDVRLLSAIDNWDLSQVVCTLSYQNQLGPAKDWKECWMKALQQIKLQEKVKAGSHLLSSNGADTVDNVHVDVEITQFQYQLVYFPVYYYGYTFSGQEYKFFINGQNGARNGERPYGLGMIGRGIDAVKDALVSGITSLRGGVVADKKTIEEWKELQRNPEKFKEN